MQYGTTGWSVFHARYPAGYHTDPSQPLPLAALASQQRYVSLYLIGLCCGCVKRSAQGDAVGTEDACWFREAWAATGRKLNMGRSCIRFK